jgi:hypothetical protein
MRRAVMVLATGALFVAGFAGVAVVAAPTAEERCNGAIAAMEANTLHQRYERMLNLGWGPKQAIARMLTTPPDISDADRGAWETSMKMAISVCEPIMHGIADQIEQIAEEGGCSSLVFLLASAETALKNQQILQ